MESSDDEFEMLPVKRRGPPVAKVPNGLDTKNFHNYRDRNVIIPSDEIPQLNGVDDDESDLVKRRGVGINDDALNSLTKAKLPEDSGKDSGVDVSLSNGNNGFYNHDLDPSNGLLTDIVNDENQVPLPVKRRGNPAIVANTESFVKHRGEREGGILDSLGDDPFDNISIKVDNSPRISPPVDQQEITQSEGNSKPANSNGLNDVLQNEMLYNPLVNVFDRMGLKEPSNNVTNGNIYSFNSIDPSDDISTSTNIDFLACQEPALRKPKGVSFDLETDGIQNSDFTIPSFPPVSANSTVDLVNIGKQDLGDNFDEMFQPIESSNFIDDLDFLEQCGGNDTDAKEELQRKSLYIRFDPLCETQGDTKQSKPVEPTTTNKQVVSDIIPTKEPLLSYNLTTLSDNFQCDNIQHGTGMPDLNNAGPIDDPFSPAKYCGSSKANDLKELHPMAKPDLNTGPVDDPFSPVKYRGSSKADNDLKELYPTTISDMNTTGLVEPLLYTQSDMDEIIKKAKCDLDDDVHAREMDWKKKYEELENKIKEEVAMRELIEQDYRGKIECIRKDNSDMKQVLSQYERTIVELTENSHDDNKSKEETLAETIRVKEQLQEDINTAEQNLFDAYKRIEKLKQTIDTYKHNEDSLKDNNGELHTKLKQSEDRYKKLREHVTEKIDGANTLIHKVRKQHEVDTAGLQASLKVAQNKAHNLELEIQQKNLENQQLSQICDDLIKKVSGE